MSRKTNRRLVVKIAVLLMVLLVIIAVIIREHSHKSPIHTGASIAYADSTSGSYQIMLYKNGQIRSAYAYSRRFVFAVLLAYDSTHHRWICLADDRDNNFKPIVVTMGEDGERAMPLQDLEEGAFRSATVTGNHIWIPNASSDKASISEYDLNGHLLQKRTLDFCWPGILGGGFGGSSINANGLVAIAIHKRQNEESSVCIFDKTGKLIATPGQGCFPMFDSSGNRLLFTHGSMGEIYDLKTKQLRHLNIGRPSFQFLNYYPSPVVNLLYFKWGTSPDTFVAAYERLWPGEPSLYSMECKDGKTYHSDCLNLDVSNHWILVPNSEL